MFQRLKGAIDARIAEELDRQRTQESASPSNSTPGTRRPAPRTASPSKRSRSSKDGEKGPLLKGPEPAEFEPEFVIDDDEVPSRTGTPRPAQEKPDSTGPPPYGPRDQLAPSEGTEAGKPDGGGAALTPVPPELPKDVRLKLRKLEKLESRYNELLRSYRIAHARVSTIEPFETTLRENTPLTTISEPGALVEYLNQLHLKGDMITDELKRVSKDRDSYKQRLDEAEKKTREAWDEVANLKEHGVINGNAPRGSVSDISRTSERPSQDDARERVSLDMDPLGAKSGSIKSPTKSRQSSIPGISLFSPKPKPEEKVQVEEETEEFFSYDSEIPRLENDLKKSRNEAEVLQGEVRAVRGDLAVARESTQSMVQTLEEATRETNTLRERNERYETELEEMRVTHEKDTESLRADLEAVDGNLRQLEIKHDASTQRVAGLTRDLEEANLQLAKSRETKVNAESDKADSQANEGEVTDLRTQLSDLESAQVAEKSRVETLNGLVAALREKLEASQQKYDDDIASYQAEAGKVASERKAELESERITTEALSEPQTEQTDSKPEVDKSQAPGVQAETAPDTTTTTKKKNKKKKKASKSAADEKQNELTTSANKSESAVTKDTNAREASACTTSDSSNTILEKLEAELGKARGLLEEKDAAIERLTGKLKGEENLREEIESLRDDLVNVGQDHVEAKDEVKELKVQKNVLQETVTRLENELKESNEAHTKSKGSEQAHKDLTTEFEDLRIKATGLQTDLSVAQQLASSRFKDLTDLRKALQKAQPELTSLRSEVAELKTAKTDLANTSAKLGQIEGRHQAIRSDLDSTKKALVERESEIRNLDQKIGQESNSRIKSDETTKIAQEDLERVESEKRQVTLSLDRMSEDLAKARGELSNSRARISNYEQQISNLTRDVEGFKEEVELKTAQYASSQSLMSSMRDQTSELAMQSKEARERCESLDEEVADAHRLLNERSREGETMRRLLADVESRADSRIREMRERMDTAIEERDRAEDDANTSGRRRARELEELRTKIRDLERSLKRAEDDRDELNAAQKDWKRRRDDLDGRVDMSTKEVEEVRGAMAELRDALDESERQARDLEKQKAELRRSVEETQLRLERLQKSNKAMSDEIHSIRTSKPKAPLPSSEAPSSRSSLDTLSRVHSPGPSRNGRSASRTPSVGLLDVQNGHQLPGQMDYVYLKNVLLQFLEQRDKKHQMQLVPVLGMLLHFDKKDEQRWMSVVNAK